MSKNKDPNLIPLTLDANEVARLLVISRRTVYRLLDAGLIPKPIKLGNATRWRRRDIDLFVQAGSMRAFRKLKRGDKE